MCWCFRFDRLRFRYHWRWNRLESFACNGTDDHRGSRSTSNAPSELPIGSFRFYCSIETNTGVPLITETCQQLISAFELKRIFRTQFFYGSHIFFYHCQAYRIFFVYSSTRLLSRKSRFSSDYSGTKWIHPRRRRQQQRGRHPVLTNSNRAWSVESDLLWSDPIISNLIWSEQFLTHIIW